MYSCLLVIGSSTVNLCSRMNLSTILNFAKLTEDWQFSVFIENINFRSNGVSSWFVRGVFLKLLGSLTAVSI